MSENVLIIVCIIIALEMLIMTIQGDLKDLGGEQSILFLLGARVGTDNTVRYGLVFKFFIVNIIAAKMVLLIYLASLESYYLSMVVIAICFIMAALMAKIVSAHSIMYNSADITEIRTHYITLYTALFVVAFSLSSVYYLDYASVIAMTVLSLIWGFCWQWVLNSSPTRFD